MVILHRALPRRMRFTVAAAILAQTLPAVSSHETPDISFAQLASIGSTKILSAQKKNLQPSPLLIEKVIGKKPTRFNRKFSKRSKSECDPDVGLLSCGFGQYCSASADSKLGGTCVPFHDINRKLQVGDGNETTSFNFEYCDPNSSYYGIYDCDCSGWDLETSTGTLNCKSAEVCPENCEDTCYTAELYFTTDGQQYSAVACYDVTKPYAQRACLGYSSDMTCEISIDDTSCTSCMVNTTSYCFDDECVSYECAIFDCENVNAGHGSTCNDELVPPALVGCMGTGCSICPDNTIAHPDAEFNFPTYGIMNCSFVGMVAAGGSLDYIQCSYLANFAAPFCCDGVDPPFVCNICGMEGYAITKPETNVSFPTGETVSCGELQLGSEVGVIGEALCGAIPAFVAEPCGCMPTDGSNVTMSPTDTITDSPVGAVTDAPAPTPTVVPATATPETSSPTASAAGYSLFRPIVCGLAAAVFTYLSA